MHGLGNDFVVIDRRAQEFHPTPERVKRYADRRTGIGFDQLLLIDHPAGDADVAWRIYNADGSEAQQCGNGARCVAALVTDGAPGRIVLEGAAGRLAAEVGEDGLVAIDMGVPDFRPAALPFDPAAGNATSDRGAYTMRADGAGVTFGAVSMGNPHIVIDVADVAEAPVEHLGPLLERHPAFPERTNVGFAQRLAADRIALRVWERGSGETRACGSGACAAVAVLRSQGALADTVTVRLRGGELIIAWPGEGQGLWMTGPATRAYEGKIATT
jgi:diaminopimelate epimerase